MWLGELEKALLTFLDGFALKLIETCKSFCPEVIRHAPPCSGDGARDGGDGVAVAANGNGIANRGFKAIGLEERLKGAYG